MIPELKARVSPARHGWSSVPKLPNMVRSGNHPIERVNHGHKENEEPAMPQILPARNADAPRRSLPMGISEPMSDDNQRLLEELHTRQEDRKSTRLNSS